MLGRTILIICFVFLYACKKKVETIKPTTESISESIYASGIIKSENQYEVFSTVNGIINNIYVSEGDTVKKGQPILSISNESQKINEENAKITADYSDLNENQGKINQSKLALELAKSKMLNDSALYFRQKVLWDNKIGSKVEFEQRELNYLNSKTAYYTAIQSLTDLKRQLTYSSNLSKKNLQLSNKLAGDYTIKSEIDGIIYSLNKVKGDMVGMQSPLAVIGNASKFVLEMQVDEYDILKIKKGLKVLVSLDSYKGKVFEAIILKIDPLMNPRSKTFLVKAEFINAPETIYPNLSFEANIVIQSKIKALLIPRNYLFNDSMVITSKGDTVIVKTGLKDYQKVEIISGIQEEDELKKP